jgi:hypothetical protein
MSRLPGLGLAGAAILLRGEWRNLPSHKKRSLRLCGRRPDCKICWGIGANGCGMMQYSRGSFAFWPVFCGWGFVADFLAKPILVGFLNGVAIHIFLGQIGKVFGFSMKSHGIIPSLL